MGEKNDGSGNILSGCTSRSFAGTRAGLCLRVLISICSHTLLKAGESVAHASGCLVAVTRLMDTGASARRRRGEKIQPAFDLVSRA